MALPARRGADAFPEPELGRLPVTRSSLHSLSSSIRPRRARSVRSRSAAGILKHGGLVAFATETVYGLGAVATNSEAVLRIFRAKGRPALNPVIVHVTGVGPARECVDGMASSAETLAGRFWPGPLTLVLKRSAIIPDVVTAGLDTVAVRAPREGLLSN